MPDSKIDDLCINTLRFLAVDAVEQAKSGHPGAPLGAAPMAYVLWNRFLKHNPKDPDWPDRDRFVLSAGHASMLLYGLLHLTGYDVPLDEIKMFRQVGSITAGHPEYRLAPGVETTTGPLGQGFANGVGMAIAEQWLASHYNRPGYEIVSHNTYAIVSDGDLQEGVSSEAASLAGTLKLGKLVYLYDDNGISIEGDTSIAFTENVRQRFESYGWQVIGPIDGFELEDVDAAISAAKAELERPSLIIARTTIGYGSPNKAGTGAVHGEPLGAEEARLTKQSLGWNYEEPFTLPTEAVEHFRKAIARGEEQQESWRMKMATYQKQYPKEAKQLALDLAGDLPSGWDRSLENLFEDAEKPISTRDAGNVIMNAIANTVHGLTGGSADLAPSTKTLLKNHGDFGFDDSVSHNMHFGIREHAMGSIANGMAVHGGPIPYTATFLIFSDYMRPPIRLAALMGLRVLFIFTHDSIGVGEDGPTHQPIEQLAALRAVPNLTVIRPADATEATEAWKIALERKEGPTVLAFTRQNLPVLDRNFFTPSEGVRQGGYILWEASEQPDLLLIATGSEVHIAIEAAKSLDSAGISVRVVSLPSWELFDAQSDAYREKVLPSSIKARISIEAGVTMGWERYVGPQGIAVGLNGFGASGKGPDVYKHFQLTAERIINEATQLLSSG